MNARTRIGIGVAVFLATVVLAAPSVLRAGGSHSYSFLQMQAGRPVTFDHCKAIRYQVNPFEAPTRATPPSQS